MPDLVQEKQLEVAENISDQSQVYSSEVSYFYLTFFTEDSEIRELIQGPPWMSSPHY